MSWVMTEKRMPEDESAVSVIVIDAGNNAWVAIDWRRNGQWQIHKAEEYKITYWAPCPKIPVLLEIFDICRSIRLCKCPPVQYGIQKE